MGFILFFGMMVFIIFLMKKMLGKPKEEIPDPPTEDVLVFGCKSSCGYFIPKIEWISKEDFEFVRKKGRLVGTCKYQGCEVCQGDLCRFAKDHPDQLRKRG